MSEDQIIDYSRQKIVNIIFVIITISVIVFTIWYENTQFVGIDSLIFEYILLPMGMFALSAILGGLSKRAIDYIPGEWQESKKWVSFSKYEKMKEEYEDAYSPLYSDTGSVGCLCCMIPLIAGFSFTLFIIQALTEPLLDPFLDSILTITLLFGIVTFGGFLWGFKIPKIDAKEFFKPPVSGDVYEFASELEDVEGIRAGLSVTLGVRGKVQTILDAEIKAFVEGLPETVGIQVHVTRSGFAYPYLVGTVYKGAGVSKDTEKMDIDARYVALIETSMDDEVAVYVARFDIPKASGSVPSIPKSDFRKLAKVLVDRLRENFEKSTS